MIKQILVGAIALSMTLLMSCGKTGKLLNTTGILEEPKIEETKIVSNSKWFTKDTIFTVCVILAAGCYHYYFCNRAYEKGFDAGGKAKSKEDAHAIHTAISSAAQAQQDLQQAQNTIQQYAQQPSPQQQVEAAYQRGTADGQRIGLANGYNRAQTTIGHLQSLINRMRPYMPANFWAPLQVPLQGNIPQPQEQPQVQQPQVPQMSNHPHANVPPNVNPNAQLNAQSNIQHNIPPSNVQFNSQPHVQQPRSVPFQHSQPRQHRHNRRTSPTGRNLPPARMTEGEELQLRYQGRDPSRIIVYTPPQPRADGVEPHRPLAHVPNSNFINVFTGEHERD
jgi:hypothetical protein